MLVGTDTLSSWPEKCDILTSKNVDELEIVPLPFTRLVNPTVSNLVVPQIDSAHTQHLDIWTVTTTTLFKLRGRQLPRFKETVHYKIKHQPYERRSASS